MGSGENDVICPHCKQETGIGTAALFDHVFMSRKRCEKCGKEFLIVDGIAMTEEQYSARGRLEINSLRILTVLNAGDLRHSWARPPLMSNCDAVNNELPSL